MNTNMSDVGQELERIRQEIREVMGEEWAWNVELVKPLARLDAILDSMGR